MHILVQDTTAPEWDETPEDQLAMFGCQFVYDLNASDLAGISAWWVDNTEFSVDSVGRVRNLVTLAPGYHSVTIYVSDTNGNILQGEFNVRVDSPLMTTGTISEPGIISSVIPFAAGVIAAVAVAVVVYIFGRRKPPAK